MSYNIIRASISVGDVAIIVVDAVKGYLAGIGRVGVKGNGEVSNGRCLNLEGVAPDEIWVSGVIG